MTTTNPIHLYRSLLREAGYLPLATCRSYIKDYIKQSFHRHHPQRDRARFPSPGAPPQAHKGNRELTLQRQTALLKRGREFHSILVRANQGSLKPFEKILSMTYGRIGRRRYELLHGFNSPVLTTRGPQPEDRAPEPREAKRSPYWKPPVQMEALLASQAKQQSLMPRNTRPKVKTPFQLTPATNIWGKPISVRRKTNQLHKWYLQNTLGVLPPLPAREYKELLSTVTGETKLPPVPTRRPVASSSTTTAEIDDEHSIRKKSTLLLSGPQGRKECNSSDFGSGLGGNYNARSRFSRRFLQRRLARTVLVQTPLAHAAEKAKRGIVFSWTDGRPRDMVYKASLPTLPKGGKQTDLLFG
jgi:hypothetical protein